jgi:hypothetical protein
VQKQQGGNRSHAPQALRLQTAAVGHALACLPLTFFAGGAEVKLIGPGIFDPSQELVSGKI